MWAVTQRIPHQLSLLLVLAAIVSLVANGFWLRNLEEEQTHLSTLQQAYKSEGERAIHPYEYPVAFSESSRSLLTKEKTTDSFALNVYHGAPKIASLQLQYSPWELTWNPAGTAVAFLAETRAKPGEYALYAWWIKQAHAVVVHGPSTTRASFACRWSPDGLYISYVAVEHNIARLVVAAVQSEGASQAVVVDHIYPEGGMAWSPDSKEVVFARQGANNFTLELMAVDEWLPRNIVQVPGLMLRSLSWSPLPNLIATTVRGADDVYWRMALITRTGQLCICPPQGGNVLDPIGLQSHGDELAYLLETKSAVSLYSGRVCASRELYRPQFDSGRVQNDGFSHSSIPFVESNIGGPADLNLIDGETGKSHSVFSSTKVDVDVDATQLWLSSSHHRFGVWMWTSNRVKTFNRAVIMVHGGPHLHETSEWEPLRSAFAKDGHLVAAPNYGGSTGYDQNFENDTDLDNQAEDLLATVLYLNNVRNITTNHITLIASSYGTRILLRALRRKPNLASLIVFSPFLASNADVNSLIPFNGQIIAYHGRRDSISGWNLALSQIRQVFPAAVRQHRLYWRLFEEEGHGLNRIASLQEEYGSVIVTESHDGND